MVADERTADYLKTEMCILKDRTSVFLYMCMDVGVTKRVLLRIGPFQFVSDGADISWDQLRHTPDIYS